MALDEATAGFLAAAAEQGGPPLHEMTPQELREMNAAMTEMFGAGPQLAAVDNRTVTSTGGYEVPVRVLRPDDPQGVVIYYHGGGWVVGGIDGFDTLCRQLAERSSMTVVLPEYRLAPENRFPAALDDAWAVLTWANDNRAELTGKESAPLSVAGDSAGGNLAAIVCQRAARNGGPDVAFQGLVYPVTSADFTTDTYNDPQNALMLTKESMVMFWDAYVPDLERRTDPEAAPLQGDPTGTPPALVMSAEHDVLRRDGALYAQKLRDAGVPVTERVIDGQMHGFFTFPNVLPGASLGMDVLVDALAEATR